jgi:hypothetical protein
MKLPVVISTLVALLVLPACDDKKDEPKRPDLAGAPASKDAGKAGADTKTPAAPGRVFFVTPANGAKVPEQFEVEFGVEGKTIEPVGTNTERNPAVGHHHLLVDTAPMPDMVVIPKDETHLHYGDGSTKATVKLPPGKHQLTMQFGDAAHRSYGPDWSATITVEVGGAPAGDAAAPGGAPAGDAVAPGGAPAGDAVAPGGAPAPGAGAAPAGEGKG